MLTKISKSSISIIQQRQFSNILKAFATVDPKNLGPQSRGYNLVKGEWKSTAVSREIIDPMNGKVMLTQPDT